MTGVWLGSSGVAPAATGSAAGALCAYLSSLAPERDGELPFTIDQGVEMGRPSRIHIAIASDAAGQITRVQVGGQAVLMAQGTLTL